MDCVGGGGGCHVGLQRLPVHHVDRAIKQGGDVVLQADIGPNADRSLRVDLDHDVGVAVGTVVAAGSRAEQGCVGHAAGAQGVSLALSRARMSSRFMVAS